MAYRNPHMMLADDDGAGFLDTDTLFTDLDGADDSEPYALNLDLTAAGDDE